ncbi:NAD(P)-binding protein [Aulographum hederae CBS 113979]|uniref:NAD(P)-binding protein n=1 Tax=Aulographum hederae CBS 113979 TaxID=1176131 RepID=A0A6G1HER1_9PEZI|nr:NAD(P)-binding protein [Aulographum hederae CBS 113979]
MATKEKAVLHDEEKALLFKESKEPPPSPPRCKGDHLSPRLIFWMLANILATIGIVFTNKLLFSTESLRQGQVSFAAFHFAVTGITLYIISRPIFNVFQAQRAPPIKILPLAAAMCLNVIMPNLSLAHSSVSFYQIARILLTPCVASLNFLISGATIPFNAGLALVPACIGVGVVSYYDSLPVKGTDVQPTSVLGITFALLGVFSSSLYTVFISRYHKTLQMGSMPLLLNQAPLSVLLLAYVIPFTDDVTVWTSVPLPHWLLIGLSGLLACVINLSQFFIVNESGPVSSTVVGHLKSCCIVALGWAMSGRPLADGSVAGIVLALGGIILITANMPGLAPSQPLSPQQSSTPSFSSDHTWLIWGGNGWIANMLYNLMVSRGLNVHTTTARMEDRTAVFEVLDRVKPTHVVNCAGITGRPNVDYCEYNKEETIRANVIGAINLADCCFLREVYLMVFATGCIYIYDEEHVEGGKPYTEEDLPNFGGSFYSYTKSRVEEIMKFYTNTLILRFRMPVSDSPTDPRSFLTKMLSYRTVYSVSNSATLLTSMLPHALLLAEHITTGVYNFTNPGAISHDEMLTMWKRTVDPSHEWENCGDGELKGKGLIVAARSACELDSRKLVERCLESII